MTISVRQMLVSSKKYKTKCPNPLDAEYITIHNTFNDASAQNEIQYMCNNTKETSFHFAIDDKEVIQGIPLDRNAWAAGDGNGTGNRKTAHVEICYSKSGGERYNKAEALTIKFVAQLLRERKWGIDRVKKHQDWSGKNCPHRILDEGRWEQFLNAISNELKKSELTNVIRYIYTGGHAYANLQSVHTYLFKAKHGFIPKRGSDGSIIFLVGPYDTGAKNFKDSMTELGKFDKHIKLLTREQVAEWKE